MPKIPAQSKLDDYAAIVAGDRLLCECGCKRVLHVGSRGECFASGCQCNAFRVKGEDRKR